MTLPLYSALVIPTVTSYPSLKCVQWSPDGQLCFITKNSGIIFTPDHGINFDNTSVIKATPGKDVPVLGWFKTMIQHDKITPTRWPEYSQAWGAVSLGSIDMSVISMAISPVGVASNGGCIFVSLSSNMDINFWIAGKNYLKGEWFNIFDLTSFLVDHFATKEKEDLASILQAQAACIEWSPRPNFGLVPEPSIDASLLILGTRAGCLNFLRYRKADNPEIVATLAVADKWITHTAFQGWNTVVHGHCEGYLAYGISDGSVGLVKISQILQENTTTFSFSKSYDIQVKLEHESSLIYGPESRTGITALHWIHVPGRSPILVSSHPGLVNLWSATSDNVPTTTAYWTGFRSLRLQTQKISSDASALHPVTGLTYLRKQDRLVVTLFDGSFHVLRSFSTDPVWATRTVVDTGGEQLTSDGLSSVSRGIFVRMEKGAVDRRDMVQVNGAVSYDDNACFLWVYESACPSDFSYKHDAKHRTTLIVTPMWEDENDELLLQDLATLLNTVKASSGYSPLYLLRPYMLHLRDPAKLHNLHSKLLEILATRPLVEDLSKTITVPPLQEVLNDDVRCQFRYSVSTSLFGWDDLLSLRMRLSLADFAWKLASNEERRTECGVVAQDLLNAISYRILRTIIRHLIAAIKSLTPNDIPFVSRMIVQSLLHGCPPELTEEGNQLSVLIQPLLNAPSSSESGTPEGLSSKLNELCPACGMDVPLEDITTAVCGNGHRWARCSVTTFILSTPWVRTCVGCSRKALLPPSAQKDLPKIAQGWVVEDLLEAVQRCLFCNNGFISIL
ncbi:Putative transcription factor tau subunit sfc9 [Psilocybe cubensis]|uniref:Transcription factor IIIC 90kDa subunit N-terminal domain-containing protein n=2 Tax=Psilocybe cubensis TaxID=181762 RepID=A0A8H7XUM9_PSICU|nr:Putative transcription factor tau subunit sfc9 [Psilocybe cubensis]KAH9476063.1 Putative transcription factor tau subunit sfc9 [Psilocybe cubensis]